MPKRKRSESVNNWLPFGGESDCDLSIDTIKRQQTDEELKPIQSSDSIQQQNSSDVKQLSANDCQLKNSSETEITTGVKTNGQTLAASSDETSLKLRRKSNRISKPIQRSLESTTTTISPNASLKKIVKQNVSQNVSNCETEKPIVNKSTKTDETNPKNSGSKGGKSLRKLQMWTNEDTKCFFEALSENGKDFPKIQSYMAQRCEKKGIPQDQIKNYEQVRHYYYRMWHKIANSLNINEVVDKNIQEIYGLINYGEIWKKFGSKFDNKLGLHLQQLVNFGHTIFKVKGKSVRVKTPICSALKKIHKINVAENTKTTSNQNLLNLPKEVCIELHPADNESWLRVHSLSQNPRVRTKMSLQKRLSTLVEYLEKRWNRSRIKDIECRTLCGTSLPNSTQVDDLCLRVRPHSSGDLNNVSLSKSVFNSQMDLSLTAYLKTLYNNELKVSSKKSKSSKSKDSVKDLNLKSPNSEQTNETLKDNGLEPNDDINKNNKNKSPEVEYRSDEDEPIAEAERSLTLLRMLEKMNEMSEEIHATDEEDDKEEDDTNKEEEERDLPSPEMVGNVCLPEPPANATLAQWLGCKDEEPDDNDVEEDNEDKKTQNTSDANEKQISLLSADRARMGWSLRETGSMTIGELYLLFRCPKTILLEYVWEPNAQTQTQTPSADVEEPVVNSGEDVNKEVEKMSLDLESKRGNNCDLLYKLLLAANVSLMNIKRPTNTSSAQTQKKKKRIKPTPAPTSAPMSMNSTNSSSQLLSSVISNTIFNDNSNDGISKTENIFTEGNAKADDSKSHHFVVPTSPAPKAINKTKNRNVCGDPALIQEALRQLQTNKYTRRQRRANPKPVFGQNKPLLPRGSPPTALTVSTTTTTSASSQQPIYVIPSHPLHINAITTVTSDTTLLSQTLPVVNMTSMTAINANSLRQSLKSRTNSDSFDVILPQKAQQISDKKSQKSVVDQLIDEMHSSNIPLIQIKPISSVSVPIISSSIHSSAQDLTQTLDSNRYSVPKPNDILNSNSISLFETNKSNEKTIIADNSIETITSIDTNVNICEVLNQKNANEAISSPDDSSNDKMPLMSSNATISSILEISLPEPPFGDNNSCSSLTTESYSIAKRPFEKLALPNDRPDSTTNANHKHTNSTDPTLPTSVSGSSSLASPPIERHKLRSPVPDSQWLNGESCDLSIGTLLNTCESPVKTVTVRDNHSLTNDVDTQMIGLVTDNSVDLISKFADLAAQINDSNSKST